MPTVTMMVTYSLSTIMDEAPPPPLQMAATPFCPGLRAWTRCRTMRAPDILQLNHNFDWKWTTNPASFILNYKDKSNNIFWSSSLAQQSKFRPWPPPICSYPPYFVFQPLMLRIYVSCSMLSSQLTGSLPLFLSPSDFVKVKLPVGANVFWYQQ